MSKTAGLLALTVVAAFVAAAAWPNWQGTLIFGAVGFALFALFAFIMDDDEKQRR